MEVGSVCRRLVFTVRRSDEVRCAAELMCEKQTDYLVVVELEPFARPVGVLTDFDIVVGAVARDLDPKTVWVRDIMTANPVTARESASMEAALQTMRELGLRRLPIVNDRHELVGVLFMEDLLKVIIGDAQQLVSLVRSEREVEAMRRAQHYVALRHAATTAGGNLDTGSHPS